MKPFISVIIPFYNVEKYIERCINSVKNQTFTNFECLLIDDESPDNSFEIAQKLIENDPRFRIIRQKNTRQGGARNNGIENAKGEYIVFLDSDDYWDLTFLEKMCSVAIKYKTDMVICNTQKVDEQGNILEICKNPFQGIVTDKKSLIINSSLDPTMVNRIYKKEIFNHLKFPLHMYYEDLAISFQTFFHINEVYFLDENLYNYVYRVGSTTKHFSPKSVDDRFIIFDEYLKPKLEQFKEISFEKSFFTSRYLLHVVLPPYRATALYYGGSFRDKSKYLKNLRLKYNKTFFNLSDIIDSWKYMPKMKFIISLFIYFSTNISLLLLLLLYHYGKNKNQ